VGNLATRSNDGDLKRFKPTDHIPMDPSGGMTSKTCVDLHFDAIRSQVRDGAYPLHMAIVAGAPLDVVEMLIKEASDILLETNKFGETPLHLALKHHVDDVIVEVMLQCGPKAVYMCDNAHGNTPVHTAAMMGCSVHVAKGLLETWQDAIHQMNLDGLTPLEVAISAGVCSEDVLRLFQIISEVF
jgi:ankyrin repeat protein